jgi:hypothetical protein
MNLLPYLLDAGLPLVIVFALGLVALLRCNKNDIPAIVRALMRMGPPDDDGGRLHQRRDHRSVGW